MSRPLPTLPLDRSKGDNIEEEIRVDGDVQRVGLQCFYTSPQALSTQPSGPSQSALRLLSRVYPHSFLRLQRSSSPQFGRLQTHLEPSQLANHLQRRNRTTNRADATPLYLEISEDLHSVQTLQFLGFQRAIAKKIFADFTSPEHENADSRLGLAELAKVYIDPAETVAESFAGTEGQPMDDIIKVVTLTQDFMGIDLEEDRLEIIDQPERPLVTSTVKDWVIEALDCRYEFLFKLDSAIVRVEMTYRRLEEDEAIRKARNRKKAEAKKAVKQKRKALKAAGADEVRAEGEGQRLLGQVQFANDAEEKGGAQASKDSKGAENSPKISTL